MSHVWQIFSIFKMEYVNLVKPLWIFFGLQQPTQGYPHRSEGQLVHLFLSSIVPERKIDMNRAGYPSPGRLPHLIVPHCDELNKLELRNTFSLWCVLSLLFFIQTITASYSSVVTRRKGTHPFPRRWWIFPGRTLLGWSIESLHRAPRPRLRQTPSSRRSQRARLLL